MIVFIPTWKNFPAFCVATAPASAGAFLWRASGGRWHNPTGAAHHRHVNLAAGHGAVRLVPKRAEVADLAIAIVGEPAGRLAEVEAARQGFLQAPGVKDLLPLMGAAVVN